MCVHSAFYLFFIRTRRNAPERLVNAFRMCVETKLVDHEQCWYHQFKHQRWIDMRSPGAEERRMRGREMGSITPCINHIRLVCAKSAAAFATTHISKRNLAKHLTSVEKSSNSTHVPHHICKRIDIRQQQHQKSACLRHKHPKSFCYIYPLTHSAICAYAFDCVRMLCVQHSRAAALPHKPSEGETRQKTHLLAARLRNISVQVKCVWYYDYG